jgi:hypothetical protein
MARWHVGGAMLGRLGEGGRVEGGKVSRGLVGRFGLLGQMAAVPEERKEKNRNLFRK